MSDQLETIESTNARSSAPTAALWAGAGVFLAWGLNWLLAVDTNNRGTIGDMFGLSNSLFSGLALVGVIYAIIVQREEMALAREELKRTKQILDDQKIQLDRQNNATQQQTFENTYFKMLDLFASLTANLDLERTGPDSNPIRGKDVFATFLKDMNRVRTGLRNELRREPTSFEVYERFYQGRNKELGHYFRLMYNIVKFVDMADVELNRKFYINILRAQLSDAELVVLMHNGLSHRGAKFKPLIEKYELLDNLPKDRDEDRDAIQNYDARAFGPDD